jgi:hypothetical protein
MIDALDVTLIRSDSEYLSIQYRARDRQLNILMCNLLERHCDVRSIYYRTTSSWTKRDHEKNILTFCRYAMRLNVVT